MPRYEERKLYLLTQISLESFSYDSQSRQFAIGNEVVGLADCLAYRPTARTASSTAEIEELVAASPMLRVSYGPILQTPKLTRWLEGSNAKDLMSIKETIVTAMIDAYQEAAGVDSSKLHRGGFMGFDFGLLRPGHPNFNVVGNCACAGIDPDGMFFDDQDWKEGFGQYTLHNIDGPSQEIALMAGAGALSQLCRTAIDQTM